MFELNPRLKQDTVVVGQFDLSMVLLHKDANYPWCILVPKRLNLRELHHLSQDDRVAIMNESCHLSEVMTDIFAPDTMNVAELGNMVPQLHIHHVARFQNDAAWPNAIWGAVDAKQYDEEMLTSRLARLRSSLSGEGFKASGIVDSDENQGEGFSP